MIFSVINWEESFNVGNQSIDNQHRQLINLYNILVETSEREKTTTSLLDAVIRQLVHYIDYHFMSEEKLFREYKYPDAELHIKEHQSFIEKVDDFQKMKKDELPVELLGYINSWITQHITIVDKKCSDYFRMSKVT